MPLPGGPADKFGNRYELWWTVAELLRMLGGETTSIRIEEPGTEKAEFVVTGPVREYHQAKRRHRDAKWTLAALAAPETGILQAMQAHLAGNADRFAFVSGSETSELAELVHRASHAASFAEFEAQFLEADVWRTAFETLQKHWGGCDAEAAYDLLETHHRPNIGRVRT